MNYQPPPPGQPQYAMPQPPLPPGAPVYELSGWWRRVGASLLDGLIVGIVASIVSLPFSGASFYFSSSGTNSGQATGFAFDTVGTIISLAVYILLVPLVMMKTDGRTIGKMATGIRVVRENGERVDFGYAMYREFLIKYLLFGVLTVFTLGLATLLNYLWPLWDDQNRALHDKIAKSRVVRFGVAPAYAAWGPGMQGMAPALYGQQPAYGQPTYGQPAAPPPPFGGTAPPPPDPFQPQAPAAPPQPPQPPFPAAAPPERPAQPYVPPAPAPPFTPPQPPPPQPPAAPAPPQPPAVPPSMPPAPPTAPPQAPVTPANAPVPPQAPVAPENAPVPPQPPAAPANAPVPPQAPPQPPTAPPVPPMPPVPPAPPAAQPMPPAPPMPPTAPPQAPIAPQPPAAPGEYQPPPGFENPVPED